MERTLEILTTLGQAHIPEIDWLNAQIVDESDFVVGDFYLSFNLIHRKIRDEVIDFHPEELESLKVIYPGFSPELWRTRSLARTIMVLNVPDEKRTKVLDDLFSTADIQELETLYRALYFLPDPGNYQYRGAEGIRTNMTSVFDALALDNPFPSEFFDEGAWNQMVLKAIFMQRPLYRITGLDDRHNVALARIATDFAHERWAASRPVSPELWRLLTLPEGNIHEADIQRVVQSDDELERSAGYLVLQAWGKELNENVPTTDWDTLGKKLENDELH